MTTLNTNVPGLGEAPPRCGIHDAQMYLSLDRGGWLCQQCEAAAVPASPVTAQPKLETRGRKLCAICGEVVGDVPLNVMNHCIVLCQRCITPSIQEAISGEFIRRQEEAKHVDSKLVSSCTSLPIRAYAESETRQLREALQKIADNYGGCHCDHTTDDCCEKVGEFCPHCISEILLAGGKSA